jgi:hypothetical protein
MGEVVGRSLNQLLPQLSRIHPRGPSATLRNALMSAGAWLRRYHQLEPAGSMTRQARRSDVVTLIGDYCEHLGRELSRGAGFAAVGDRLVAAAERLLPEELPLALTHGDFAMRNVLVTATGQVVIFDTLAIWRAPLFEDLAKFGLAMRFTRMQTYSHGMLFGEGRLRAAEDWLQAGYFGDEPVPRQQIRLYAALLLLDKWSFELSRPTGGPLVARARAVLVNAWCDRLMRNLLAEIR